MSQSQGVVLTVRSLMQTQLDDWHREQGITLAEFGGIHSACGAERNLDEPGRSASKMQHEGPHFKGNDG